MCGIAGILRFSGAPEGGAEALRTLGTTMGAAMAHRGPDGAGVWADARGRVMLAHRRLAIIDLTDDAAQPMANEDGAVRVTFNGEIYNHAELRRELIAAGHIFQSDHSDTETIVHGYEQWGLDGLLERLDGMFAFAIWDEARETLSLARDRIGIKPLYFTRAVGDFRFASEIKAFMADPAFPRAVEPVAISHYLSFLVTPAPLTMFRDVFKLPAGHAMEVDAKGALRAWRHWQAEPGRGFERAKFDRMSEREQETFLTGGIRTRLEDAVAKRNMSDVPFGAFLSGGIDSTANVALMRRVLDRPVNTFTVGFSDHTHLNELDEARRASKAYGTHHHEVLVNEANMTGYLDDLVHHQDEPLADWVCIPLYFVSKLARDNGITVVQVGEGADEQFCGYRSYMAHLSFHRKFWAPYMHLPGFLRQGIGAAAGTIGQCTGNIHMERATDFLRRAGRNEEAFWAGAHAFWDIQKDKVAHMPAFGRAGDWSILEEAGLMAPGLDDPRTGRWVGAGMAAFDAAHPATDPLNRMAHAEFRLRLPELLLGRVDKITMSTSIEGRVPFLDHRLVDFTMDIPQAWKVRGGEPKYLLKQAMAGIVPDDILYRKKMGFNAPMDRWLRGDFGRKAKAGVMASGLLKDGLLKAGHVRRLFDDHQSGKRNNALHLWALINLTAWHDHWIG